MSDQTLSIPKIPKFLDGSKFDDPQNTTNTFSGIMEETEEGLDEDTIMDISSRATLSSLIYSNTYMADHERISFRSFIPEPTALATYYPSAQSSPLMNPTTARIFCHWVYVVAPSLSIFEINPPNPQNSFTPGVSLNGPQNVWTYVVPMLSLTKPLLLHALLAVSSLHIAHISGEAIAPSHIHYHLALRRLRKALESKVERSSVATLAGTLLLAYYETISADVQKWCNHVQGAKNLFRDIDFDIVSENCKLSDQANFPQKTPQTLYSNIPEANSSFHDSQMQGSDDVLTSYLLGYRGREHLNSKARHRRRHSKGEPPSRQDIDTCILQRDLFWMFAKMDAYQAVLSGNGLT